MISLQVVNIDEYMKFYPFMEMIARHQEVKNARGNCLTPNLQVKIEGLQSDVLYEIVLTIERVDDQLYVFQKNHWEGYNPSLGKIPHAKYKRLSIGKKLGVDWMEEHVSLDKVRITNDQRIEIENEKQALYVTNFYKYVPILHIIPIGVSQKSLKFPLDHVQFISVDRYYNDKLAVWKRTMIKHVRRVLRKQEQKTRKRISKDFEEEILEKCRKFEEILEKKAEEDIMLRPLGKEEIAKVSEPEPVVLDVPVHVEEQVEVEVEVEVEKPPPPRENIHVRFTNLKDYQRTNPFMEIVVSNKHSTRTKDDFLSSHLRISFDGMEEDSEYEVFLSIERVNSDTYTFSYGKWKFSESTKKKKKFVHQYKRLLLGKKLGASWMKEPVSLNKVQYTNRPTMEKKYDVLYVSLLMKHIFVVHIINKKDPDNLQRFPVDNAQFVPVEKNKKEFWEIEHAKMEAKKLEEKRANRNPPEFQKTVCQIPTPSAPNYQYPYLDPNSNSNYFNYSANWQPPSYQGYNYYGESHYDYSYSKCYNYNYSTYYNCSNDMVPFYYENPSMVPPEKVQNVQHLPPSEFAQNAHTNDLAMSMSAENPVYKNF